MKKGFEALNDFVVDGSKAAVCAKGRGIKNSALERIVNRVKVTKVRMEQDEFALKLADHLGVKVKNLNLHIAASLRK